MSFYTPIKIDKFETGLVEDRPEFLIPNDAFPVLENMFIWREKLIRKSGNILLGRLQRSVTALNIGMTSGGGAYSNTFISGAALGAVEANASIIPGSVTLSDGVNTFTDNGLGVLTGTPGGSGTINYASTQITITGAAGGANLLATLTYAPGIPVMGLRSEELTSINAERLIAFDRKYAYRYLSGWQEFIPGTTWTGTDSNFFWSTNYWVDKNNVKIFWATNFYRSGAAGDPIRYTNGTAWEDFAPQIDSGGNILAQCLAMIPFRGRMVVFNTYEGATFGTSIQYPQRIRWAAIGNPFTTATAIVTTVSADAWRDDIPGKGGFLDIPTAEDIVSIGFVRDNLVIFCERSTWQLRYTGRSIAPFAVEKINTELGAESTFSAIQFDTSLVGVGDKGIVECDSFSSKRIDVKIPDLTFRFNNDANGPKRVHGIRDFQQRIAYWTYPEVGFSYPNKRLVYNYENDSWAIFKDSYTCLGTFQNPSAKRWQDFPGPDKNDQWQSLTQTTWQNLPSQFPSIVGGNQQGFVEFLGQINFNWSGTSDYSLYIQNIVGNTTTATTITSTDHNLVSDDYIRIDGIPTGTPFASSLNGKTFKIEVINSSTFNLLKFNTATQSFDLPQTDAPATYVGGGYISVLDNINVMTKKFNFLDDGNSIQIGNLDLLMNYTDEGQITMNVLVDYNDTEPVNQYPQNDIAATNSPDTFFNVVIPTNLPANSNSSKNWQKIYCNARGSLISLQFTMSDAQMNSNAQDEDITFQSIILWARKAGTQLPAGLI